MANQSGFCSGPPPGFENVIPHPPCKDFLYATPVSDGWGSDMQGSYSMNAPLSNDAESSRNFAQVAAIWNLTQLTQQQNWVSGARREQDQLHCQQQRSSGQKMHEKPLPKFPPIGSGRRPCHAAPEAHANESLSQTDQFGPVALTTIPSNKVSVFQLHQFSAMQTRCSKSADIDDFGKNGVEVPMYANRNRKPILCRKGIYKRIDDYKHKGQVAIDSDDSLFDVTSELPADRTPPNDLARKLTAEMYLSRKLMNVPETVEKAAIMHRHAALNHDAAYTWSGILPHRKYDKPVYSSKVFLGGVPWDITVEGLQQAFSPFGSVKVEFPVTSSSKNGRLGLKVQSMTGEIHCHGYVYVIFDGDKQVKSMLLACRENQWLREGTACTDAEQDYYYPVPSKKIKSKEVQVIPWLMSDTNYIAVPRTYPYHKLDNDTTVFVGALHGMLNAEGLAHVMNDLFGDVVYAGIDTDKHKYPIGSGRVTFSSHKSYMKAVNAAFVEIKTTKFVKKVQIDPYLEEMLCSHCSATIGPYFCRNQDCFKYYCSVCWTWVHDGIDPCTGVHSPIKRNSKE